MKRVKNINISEDVRWDEYNDLKKKGDTIKACKLKETILDSFRYKKPCHHMSER